MSDTQSITYNTGLNAVAVDSVGNLVTDSAGNLVIPILPVTITINSEPNHVDCQCAIVNVIGGASHTFRPCSGNLPYRQNSVNWLGKATDIHAVQLVSNLRNVNMESLSFDIIAGIQVYRELGEFSPSYMQVIIQWGDSWIKSEKYYVCHQSSKVFNIGNISINLNNNTLTYTGVDLPTNASSVKCEQADEPEIIIVEAPYSWCSKIYYHDGRVDDGLPLFTEEANVGIHDRVWPQEKNTVEIEHGQSEEDAKNSAALSKITTVTSRRWISTQYPEWARSKRFWRDEEKDVDYRPVAVQELIPCALATGNGWNGTNVGTVSMRIFTSNHPEHSEITGKVYNRGCPNTLDIGIAKQYLLEDAKVLASDLPFIRVPSELATKYSDEWYKQGYPILLSLRFANATSPGGLAVAVPCRSSGRTMVLHNQTWYHYKSQSLPGHYEHTHDIWATQGSTGDYGSIFIDTEPNEDYNGQLMDMVAFWYYWLDYDGSLWIVGSDEHSRYYLYEIAQYPAWTLSPCHRTGVSDNQVTVYTDPQTLPDDVTAGDNGTTVYVRYENDYDGDGDFDDLDEIYYWPEGQVTATGSSVYSFTTPQDTNLYSVVHYWNGSTESKAIIDEEFE